MTNRDEPKHGDVSRTRICVHVEERTPDAAATIVDALKREDVAVDVSVTRTRDGHERFRRILESLGDPVYTVDADCRYTFVNDAYAALTGYETVELVGRHVSFLLDDSSVERTTDSIRSLLAGETERQRTHEITVETSAGETIQCEDTVAAVAPDGGQRRHVAGVVRDISERTVRDRERQAETDRLDRFASTVSHELRNPLTVAQGRLEQARDTCDCSNDDLAAVAWAHDRMATLIEDVVTLTRDRDPDPEIEPVDLATVVEDCWHYAETGAATLRIETDAVVRADRTWLTQLLENLLYNAIEHGSTDADPQAGQDGEPDDHEGAAVTITVGTVPETDGGGFYVADDGPGIPSDDREYVFEGGYSSAEGGTGLGLAIVQRIATAHGWTVAVSDSATGGARFELTGIERVDC